MKNLYLTFILACVAFNTLAQQPQLLKDINKTPGDFVPDSYTVRLVSTGSHVFFPKDPADYNSRWWVTDGTTAGTHVVDPTGDGYEDLYFSGAAFDGSFYYINIPSGSISSPGDHSRLMKYTPESSTLVILKEFDGDVTVYPISNNDQMIFAVSADTDMDLWKSDGTTEGTVKFTTLPDQGNILFVASDGSYSYFVEQTQDNSFFLWRTDGTEAGTILIKSGGPNFADYYSDIYATGNDLYFYYGESSVQSTGLWKTDGTVEGTEKIVDVGNGQQFTIQNVGGKIIFSNGGVLWASDGTPEGTAILSSSLDLGAFEATVFNDLYYYIGNNQDTQKRFLGKSDGTEEGTGSVVDIGTERFYFDRPFYHLSDKLVFSLYVEGKGEELGVSDGTAEGTILVKDIFEGTTGSYPRHFTPIGNKMLFTAVDDVHGREPWITDGTEAGTMLVKDMNAGTSDALIYSSGTQAVAVGDKLIFPATDNKKAELWISDGTETNTKKIFDDDNTGITYIGNLNGAPYYGSLTDNTGQIIRINANEVSEQVKQVSNYFAAGRLYTPNSLEVNGKLFFLAYQPSTSTELWITDGTGAGTHLVKDINPSGTGINNSYAAILSGKLYLNADDGTNGNELWVSDGTEDGTKLLVDITDGSGGSSLYYFYSVNNRLCFFEDHPTLGKRLWTSDGTAEGTQVIHTFPLNSIYNINMPVVIGDKLVFTTNDSEAPRRLWQTDGTADGTTVVKTFDAPLAFFSNLFLASGKAFFNIGDEPHGNELWTTDGTEAGTTIIDLTPGTDGTPINRLYSGQHGLFYFSNNNNVWASGGTVETTVKVADGMPDELQVAGNAQYFGKKSAEYGREWFTLPFTKIPQSVMFEDIGDKKVGDADFDLSASATSGLPVTFTASPDDRVTITGSSVKILKAGKVTITATQAGNDGIASGEESQTICIIPAKPTISLKEIQSGVNTLQSSEAGGDQWYLNGTGIDGATDATFEATEDGSYTAAGSVDGCVGEASDALTVVITGLQEESIVSVFPNPAKDKLYVRWNGTTGGISLVDSRGASQLTKSFVNNAEISIGHLSPGLYILKLTSSERQVIKKFIKE